MAAEDLAGLASQRSAHVEVLVVVDHGPAKQLAPLQGPVVEVVVQIVGREAGQEAGHQQPGDSHPQPETGAV